MNPMMRMAGILSLIVTIFKIGDVLAPNTEGVMYIAANAPILYAAAVGLFMFGFTRHWLLILSGVVGTFLLLTAVGF